MNMTLEQETIKEFPAESQQVVEQALHALDEQMAHRGVLKKFEGDRVKPEEIESYIKLSLAGKPVEYLYAFFVNNAGEVIYHAAIWKGTTTQVLTVARDLVKQAMELKGCTGLFIAHNHPGGTTEPSDADVNIALKVKLAMQLFDYTLYDSFVVSGTTGEVRSIMDEISPTSLLLKSIKELF